MYKVGNPTVKGPAERGKKGQHKQLYAALDAAGGKWLPVECPDSSSARGLGITVQQRYRTSRKAGAFMAETRVEGRTLWLRLVPRKEGRP